MRNSPADALNKVLEEKAPALLGMLSRRGRALYFPHAGILGQSAEAKGKKYNATIGIASEEDGSPLRLATMEKLVNLPPAEVFPYAPSFGLPDLREAWKKMLLEKNPSLKGISFSQPVVTQALTHGLAVAGTLFLDDGDEILIPEPLWDNYYLLFETIQGARVAGIPAFKGDAFDLDTLRSALAARQGKKVVILLNFPNNPSGYTPTEQEMHGIASALVHAAQKGSKVVAVIDDAYFGLVYEQGVARESLFARIANAHENLLALKLDGATKEDYVWGLRVGFATFGIKGADEAAYKALVDKAAGAVRGTISNCSILSQSLLLRSFRDPAYAAEKQRTFGVLQARYRRLKDTLAGHPEYRECFKPLPFNSGYFMCVQPAPGIDAEKARKLLLEKYQTGLIAMGGLLRIAFSTSRLDDIPAILDNVYKACKEVSGRA